MAGQKKSSHLFLSSSDDMNLSEGVIRAISPLKPYENRPSVIYIVRSDRLGVKFFLISASYATNIGNYIPYREFDMAKDWMGLEDLSREEFDEGVSGERYYIQDILDNWTREEIWEFFNEIAKHTIRIIDSKDAQEMGGDMWLREVRLVYSNAPRPGDIQIIQSGE